VIGLDTNVLLRWIIPDVEGKLSSSAWEIERVSKIFLLQGAQFFINPVVLAETAWMLEKKLKLARPDVSEVVTRLLHAENITVGNDSEVRAAQDQFDQSGANLADCVIAQLNLTAGCPHTLTFDREAAGTAGFRHVDDA
jgi:predicted nucleic-acid-binding protein